MARRLSNRERIQRRALEAAAKAAEKEKPPSKRTRASKKAAPPQRVKTVWKVFNNNIKEVGCFPYPEKAKADALAARLTEKTGKEHFVNGIKVPMADDE